ncbi:MAG: hypothetical protein ACI9K2_003166 [Myxococcota bacterium]
MFGEDLSGRVAPALCAFEDSACWTALPEGTDDWVEAAAIPIVGASTPWTWAGDAIDVGPHTLPFFPDPVSGVAGYSTSLAAAVLPDARLVLGGELGPFDAPGGLRSAGQVALLSPTPGAVLDLSAPTLPFAWEPSAPGRIVIEVRGLGAHRLFGPTDDGATELDLGFLGPRGIGDAVEVVAWRLHDTVHDVHGNTVVARSAVRHAMVAAVSEPSTCAQVLAADPSAPSGPYALQPDPLSPAVIVRCDMETDGGGWSLVANTAGTPLSDEAGPWHDDLATERPVSAAPWVWDGLRAARPGDIRFSCRFSTEDPSLVVDLSFYDVDWYQVITTGTELESCFLPDDGAGFGVPPARRDNVTGEDLPEGEPWAAGYLEGEDHCREPRDFTVDLRDRGMDGNQSDGTDWGLDDDMPKCGTEGAFTGEWSIWVR